MKRILIWDLPTRICHWAFAFALTAAMAIGFLADDDSPLFQFHMLFGIVALFLLGVRLVMGIAGSRYARFSSYPLRPAEVAGYFLKAVFSKTRSYAGNNPGSAVAAALMFLLVLSLFVSGISPSGGEIGEIHESFAWALLVVVGLHVAGILWHTFRHRENIAFSMVDGRKPGEPEAAIQSAHPLAGVAVLVVTCAWAVALFANHNPQSASVTLPVIGTTLRLGENEHGESTHGLSRHPEEHNGRDDD